MKKLEIYRIITILIILFGIIVLLNSLSITKAEDNRLVQYVGKVENKLATNEMYRSANSTITVELKGTDNNYLSNNLTTDNIIVKVDGVIVTPTTKMLSSPRLITNGVGYTLTLKGVPGNGILTIDVSANTLTDKAQNKNILQTFATGIIMDNISPTISDFKFPGSYNFLERQQGELLIDLDATKNNGISYDGTTTTWKNLVSEKTDGKLNGCTWTADGLLLDGVDDWVDLGDVTNNTECIEATFTPYKVENTAQQFIIGNWENGGGGIFIQDGKIKTRVYIKGAPQNTTNYFSEYKDLISTTNISNGQKYTVKLKFDADNYELYVNGKLESQLLFGDAHIVKSDVDTSMVLGANPRGSSVENSFFKGVIHSIKVYDDYKIIYGKTSTSMCPQTTASDADSGIAKYEYYLDGVLNNTVETSAEKTQNNYQNLTVFNTYILKVRVYDKAGNYVEKTLTEDLDNFIEAKNITRDGYDVYLYSSIADIKAVSIPTWSRYNVQDEIKWMNATKQEDKKWYFRVNVSDHNYEAGLYASHCYITAGSTTIPITGIDLQVPTENYRCVKNIARSGYWLYYYNNNSTISKVKFPSWTAYNGQDDLEWAEVNKNDNGSYVKNQNGAYIAKIHAVNHNCEYGQYISHIYYAISEKEYGDGAFGEIIIPGVEEYYIEGVSSTGYWVTCWTLRSGLTSISVPTWTESGGQDDIVWHSSSKIGNGAFQARINVSDHGYQNGTYISHVYGMINGTNTALAGLSTTVTGASPPATHTHNFNGYCNTLHSGVGWSCTCGGYHYTYYHIVCTSCGARSGEWTCPNGPLGVPTNWP